MALQLIAGKVVEYFLLQFTSGAIEKLGSDAKDYISNIIILLSSRFRGRRELEEASKNPKALEALIIAEASKDYSFHDTLMNFVEKLITIEGSKDTRGQVDSQVFNGTSIGNINVSGDNINLDNNQQFFRSKSN